MQLFLAPQSGHTLSFIFVIIYRVHFVYSYDHQVMSVAVHHMVCKFIKQQVLHDTWRLTCDHERALGGYTGLAVRGVIAYHRGPMYPV